MFQRESMALVSLSLDGSIPPSCQGGAITLGNFDGVHLGHQALLKSTIEQARKLQAPAVAVSFEPHPLQLLRPEAFQPVLTTLEQKADLLHQYGVDQVIVLETTPALLQLTAQAFFEQIIRARLQARAISEGFNFGFGKNRQGTAETLQTFGKDAGMAVTLVPALEILGKPVSSSRVRNELVAGNVSLAQILLGRPFRLVGTVGTGQRRGQTLGFPTANLVDVLTLIPGNGVYAVRAWVEGKDWPAAANIGPNPTFGEQARKIEVHLIGFQGDLYGQKLAIDFLARLRATRPFAGIQELISQLQEDVARAREVWAESSPPS